MKLKKEESETCLIDEEIEEENKDYSKEMEKESTPKKHRILGTDY